MTPADDPTLMGLHTAVCRDPADCRRHAPAPQMGLESARAGIISESHMARFPLTLLAMWCGEWEAATGKEPL